MDRTRGVTYATVAVVVLVTAATGPVGLIAIPEAGAEGALGTGSAAVSVVSSPDTVRIDRGEYGTDTFNLRVPDTVLDVESVDGSPILTYAIAIDELGYSRSSVHVLSSDREGTIRVGIEGDTFESGELTADRYDAQLRLVLRGNETRTVYSKPVTVVVAR